MSGMTDHIWKEKGNYLPWWDDVEIIDSEEHYRLRQLKEAVHMLDYSDLLSRLSTELNMIWLIDGTLTGTAAPIQGGLGSNSNEETISNSTSLRNLNLIIGCRFISYLEHLL